MSTERKWTSAQIDAMDTRGKTLLVSAAAGSGKTATLTSRRPSGLRKTIRKTNSLAHRTTWLRSDLKDNGLPHK